MSVNNVFIAAVSSVSESVKSYRSKMPGDVVVVGPVGGGKELILSGDDLLAGSVAAQHKHAEFRELIGNVLKFDIGALLRLRSFLYLLTGTGIFLFQTHNTLTVISLAQQNEKLREQIQMTSSVITSQELKVHELHSIHNIAKDAAALGLIASSVPPVEIQP